MKIHRNIYKNGNKYTIRPELVGSCGRLGTQLDFLKCLLVHFPDQHCRLFACSPVKIFSFFDLARKLQCNLYPWILFAQESDKSIIDSLFLSSFSFFIHPTPLESDLINKKELLVEDIIQPRPPALATDSPNKFFFSLRTSLKSPKRGDLDSTICTGLFLPRPFNINL